MNEIEKPITRIRSKDMVQDFLDSYDAKLVSVQLRTPTSILLYDINDNLIIVTVDDADWELYLPVLKSDDIMDTLKRAEEFLEACPGEN